MRKTAYKIAVMTPRAEFSLPYQQKLSKLGIVKYTDSRRSYPIKELLQFASQADVLAFDPDNIGGFEVAKERLVKLLKQVPTIKHLALATTSYGYVDASYCKKRGITVSNVPHYSSESVAEHTIALLLGCAKRIYASDRASREGKYQLTLGQEVAEKTLGIIGLGSIGSRTATLAQGLGMKVVAYNRTPKKIPGVKQLCLQDVVKQAVYLSLHLIDNKETEGIISKRLISQMKKGVIIVNTASRDLVDEKALADALKKGFIDSYALEAEDLISPPLGNLKNAFLFKGFGWYTKEALERNKEIWVNNIQAYLNGNPHNLISYN